MPSPFPSPQTLQRLKDAAGPGGWSEDAQVIAPYLVEWRGRYRGHTPLLLLPHSVEAVAAILRVAHETGTPIVPQGGNTGLSGGQIPDGQVLLSLTRLNRLRAIDITDNVMVCEAGVTLLAAQEAAAAEGRLFPLSLAAEGSATIGGVISTNAGGTGVLRYGNARDLVLGLEVVLADGRVLNGLKRLRKDNTGYDLKQLFIGSEGSLGIVTAAALKLFPAPRTVETAFAAVRNPDAALALLHRLQAASGGLVSGFEMMPAVGLQFVLAHIPGTRPPFVALPPWSVLIEIASSAADAPLRAVLERGLAQAIEDGLAGDAVIAKNAAERDQFWRLREALSEAQKHEGLSLKHDVSVPLSRIARFLEAAEQLVLRLCPAARIVAFGHLGDGNIHYNISQPIGDAAGFVALGPDLTAAIHDLVRAHEGSISAEHGIGQLKRDEIARTKSAVEMDLMRAIKRALDPLGLLNPGKVLSRDPP